MHFRLSGTGEMQPRSRTGYRRQWAAGLPICQPPKPHGQADGQAPFNICRPVDLLIPAKHAPAAPCRRLPLAPIPATPGGAIPPPLVVVVVAVLVVLFVAEAALLRQQLSLQRLDDAFAWGVVQDGAWW